MTSPKHLLNKQTDDAKKANPPINKPEQDRDYLEIFFKVISIAGIISFAGILIWYFINAFLLKNNTIASAQFLISGG